MATSLIFGSILLCDKPLGSFGHWIERLSSFYEAEDLYPGTLNLELTSEYSLPSDVIRLEADEYGGSVSVSMVPCRIFVRFGFLMRTDSNEKGMRHQPRNIIEIATDLQLPCCEQRTATCNYAFVMHNYK